MFRRGLIVDLRDQPCSVGFRYLSEIRASPACPYAMSACPLKADMGGAKRNVRFGPKADICSAIGHVRFTRESGYSSVPLCTGISRSIGASDYNPINSVL